MAVGIIHFAKTKKDHKDTLKFKPHVATGAFRTFTVYDKHWYMAFIPSLGLSAVGETKKELNSDIQIQLQTFFEDLWDMAPEKAYHYLIELGWKRGAIHKSKYSNAFVDKDGFLKGLDLPKDAEINEKVVSVAG